MWNSISILLYPRLESSSAKSIKSVGLFPCFITPLSLTDWLIEVSSSNNQERLPFGTELTLAHDRWANLIRTSLLTNFSTQYITHTPIYHPFVHPNVVTTANLFLIGATHYIEVRNSEHNHPILYVSIIIHPSISCATPLLLTATSPIHFCPHITLLWHSLPQHNPPILREKIIELHGITPGQNIYKANEVINNIINQSYSQHLLPSQGTLLPPPPQQNLPNPFPIIKTPSPLTDEK